MTIYDNETERKWIIDLINRACDRSGYYPDFGELADAILARYASRPTPEWHPISTVPRSGVRVDLLYPEPIGRVIDCTWNLNWGVERGLHWIWHGRTAEFITAQPTHWMLSPGMPMAGSRRRA